jgi:hypothetical protein
MSFMQPQRVIGVCVMQDFDSYGVPTFFMNEPVAEPAGGGNVRVWNCVRRHGVLVPVCEIIIPAAELLVASRIITQAAMEAFKAERQMMLLAH